MLKPLQRGRYFRAVAAAWAAEAVRIGSDPDDSSAMNAWRKEQEWNVCQVTSSNELHPIDGFDRMMLHYAVVAGDDRGIHYFTLARQRRIKFILRQTMQRLADLEQRPVTWDYIRSIMTQMQIPTTMEDCPDEQLLNVHTALDIHVRRLAGRQKAAVHAA